MRRIITVIVLSIASCMSAVAEEARVATVESVWGYATVIRGETQLLARPDMVLLPSDRVVTHKSSGMRMIFLDGTQVSLGALLHVDISQYISVQGQLAHDFLLAQSAVRQAKAAQAGLCAPKLLAAAESQLSKVDKGYQGDQDVVFISQAMLYAKQAKARALQACKAVTTVILLPDEHGEVGQISLRAHGVTQVIDRAFHSSSVQGVASTPTAAKAMSKEDVMEQFSTILKSQPAKRARFTLYFATAKSTLNKSSIRELSRVLQAAQARKPTEIHIVAHTDAMGSSEKNMRISRERAEAVQAMLFKMQKTLGPVYLKYHGENDPLVVTPDGVAEPRNRRVEVMVL